MNSDASEGLRQDLLDDFYAECDELLTTIRRAITELEKSGTGSDSVPSAVEELFRAMHSLKGICAIAGVSSAEELAHAVEDLLRGVTRREIEFTPALLDLSLASADRLEKVIAAHRQRQRLPDIADLVSRLTARKPTAPAPAPLPLPTPAPRPPAADGDPVSLARRQGLRIWRVIFVPSPSLEQRGIKINTVRERLGSLGSILSATPVIQAGGLRFVFVLGTPADVSDLATWERDGVQFEAIEAPKNTSAPPAPVPAPPAADAAKPAGEESDVTLGLTPSHLVRVDLSKLDDLMRITGEIIIQRTRLQDRLTQQVNRDDLKDIDLALGRSLRELRLALSRVRLVPVGEIFSRLPYVLRDLVRGSDRRARLVVEGEQTEIDKRLVERLKEPLLHLVRNSFAHGVETPAERVAAGKPAEATLTLRAARSGDAVEIQVSDDGRGIDANRVAARATQLGLKIPSVFDADRLLAVLCEPGFSTRDAADRAAGRGVGMAVVLNTVRELGGSLRLETEPGRGTRFLLRLPLTLSITDALIVEIGAQICALPQGAIEEIFQAPPNEVRNIQRTEVLPYRKGLLPVVRLRERFQLPTGATENLTVVVVTGDRGSTGLVVDRVRSRREIVIRPLADPLVRTPGIAGATELGDGRPVLVLDPAAFTAGVVRPALESTSSASSAP